MIPQDITTKDEDDWSTVDDFAEEEEEEEVLVVTSNVILKSVLENDVVNEELLLSECSSSNSSRKSGDADPVYLNSQVQTIQQEDLEPSRVEAPSLSSDPSEEIPLEAPPDTTTTTTTTCYGGHGGTPFDDGCNVGILSGIALRAGNLVDGISLFYRDTNTDIYDNNNDIKKSYGGEGGEEQFLFLCLDEYVTHIEVGWNSKYVTSLLFRTNRNRTLGPCGGNGGLFLGGSCSGSHTITAPQGQMLVGIKGRQGIYLDSIGFHFRSISHYPSIASVASSSSGEEKCLRLTTSPLYGGTSGGTFFDDGHCNLRIMRIAIRSGDVVDSISVTYYTGKVVHYGGYGGTEESITLPPGEWITEVHVCHTRKLVHGLSFTTNLQRSLGSCGGRKQNGGFLLFDGINCNAETAVVKAPEGQMLIGIKGRAGKFLDCIGFHWSPIPC